MPAIRNIVGRPDLESSLDISAKEHLALSAQNRVINCVSLYDLEVAQVTRAIHAKNHFNTALAWTRGVQASQHERGNLHF